MIRIVPYIMLFLSLSLCGCATTGSSEWSAKSVGQGMQLGAAGSSGNPLSGIVWGIGFLVEQVGGAIESTPPKPEQLDDSEVAADND